MRRHLASWDIIGLVAVAILASCGEPGVIGGSQAQDDERRAASDTVVGSCAGHFVIDASTREAFAGRFGQSCFVAVGDTIVVRLDGDAATRRRPSAASS